jgi:hypothetical protein
MGGRPVDTPITATHPSQNSFNPRRRRLNVRALASIDKPLGNRSSVIPARKTFQKTQSLQRRIDEVVE